MLHRNLVKLFRKSIFVSGSATSEKITFSYHKVERKSVLQKSQQIFWFIYHAFFINIL